MTATFFSQLMKPINIRHIRTVITTYELFHRGKEIPTTILLHQPDTTTEVKKRLVVTARESSKTIKSLKGKIDLA